MFVSQYCDLALYLGETVTGHKFSTHLKEHRKEAERLASKTKNREHYKGNLGSNQMGNQEGMHKFGLDGVCRLSLKTPVRVISSAVP